MFGDCLQRVSEVPYGLYVLAIWPLAQMGRAHLSRLWLVMFLGLAGGWLFGYGTGGFAAWASLTALWSIWLAWLALRRRYAGQPTHGVLLGCAVGMTFTLFANLSTGVGLMLGLGVFSWLHCWLHEREERAVAYGAVSPQAVLRRWLYSWGLYAALPMVCLCLVGWWFQARCLGLAGCSTLVAESGEPAWGYFTSFHREFAWIWRDIAGQESKTNWPLILLACGRSMVLLLLGALPVLGLLGAGYRIPGRFAYRLLQRPDEELLLVWLCGLSLIVSTSGRSDSAAIATHGLLALLLAVWVFSLWWGQRRRR